MNISQCSATPLGRIHAIFSGGIVECVNVCILILLILALALLDAYTGADLIFYSLWALSLRSGPMHDSLGSLFLGKKEKCTGHCVCRAVVYSSIVVFWDIFLWIRQILTSLHYHVRLVYTLHQAFSECLQ